jgi:hypothetical protein
MAPVSGVGKAEKRIQGIKIHRTTRLRPAVLLALGAFGWLAPELSQVLAEAVVVLRLAATGIIVRRISGHDTPLAGLWSGFALAGIGVVIAALKYILTH